MKPSETLRRTKALLEESEWKQGSAVFQEGCYCTMTAINHIAEVTTDRNRALRVFQRVNGFKDVQGIIRWNDWPRRTKEEVLKAFDRAIYEARKTGQ